MVASSSQYRQRGPPKKNVALECIVEVHVEKDYTRTTGGQVEQVVLLQL